MIPLRDVLRTLLRRPLITAVAVMSLAFGIGANVAIFSVFYQALLRQLPVPEPGALVNLRSPGPRPGNASTDGAIDVESLFSYPMFRDLARAQTVFTGLAAHRPFPASIEFNGRTAIGTGVLVSGSYFPVLGLQPALGRLLGPNDDRRPGEDRVVVLSHDYWRGQLGQNPSVLNALLVVNGETMTIAGVAPRGFEGTTVIDPPQVFVPLTMSAAMRPGWRAFDDRRDWSISLFARLRPGISREAAQQAINIPFKTITRDVELALYAGASPQVLDAVRRREIRIEAGDTGQRPPPGRIWTAFALLLTVTGTVLIVACSNVAQLLLARASARSREMSIRLAIGATRRQLLAQVLGESCVLALLGMLVGLIVARWTLDLIASFMPARAAMLVDLDLDFTTWLFLVGITSGAGLLAGLFPAWHSTRSDVMMAVKNQSTHLTGGQSATKFRLTLATAQIGLSMTLLIMAGLFARSLWNLSRIDLGFESANLVTFQLLPGRRGYDAARSSVLLEQVREELARIPGIAASSVSTVPLLTGANASRRVIVDRNRDGADASTNAGFASVGVDYFRTLGVPLIAGREFTRADSGTAQAVAIVNEAFGERLGLGKRVVGTRFRIGEGTGAELEIVGLVRNTKYSQAKAPAPPQFFLPLRPDDVDDSMTFYARTTAAPALAMQAIPAAIAGLDRTLPVENLRTMRDQLRANTAADRLTGTLSVISAALATFLAAIGLYGMLTYAVTQRTREIGVRMALGADSGDVRRMVLGQVLWMIAAGGSAGIVIAFGLGRVAQSLLFGLESHDPAVVTGSAATLALVALGAGMLPAYQASRIDPIRALQSD